MGDWNLLLSKRQFGRPFGIVSRLKSFVSDKLTGEEIEIFDAITWSLLRSRNIGIYEAKWRYYGDVLESTGSLLRDYQLSNKMGLDFAGIGAVIRDAASVVISCLSKRVAGLFSPHVAECIAMREGLEMATACGIVGESVESDAANIV
ncbi:hypothetical protein TIFTF001_014195 [Ficus carica]|uniref:RNase H type-1 domain-containing protein n=1 Tax=Ficus carica TaxID=3494 RepID=A0AA87ZWC7_FICCA|nr:hypothetical protein TIFTF001_014195 [Ficus carica]